MSKSKREEGLNDIFKKSTVEIHKSIFDLLKFRTMDALLDEANGDQICELVGVFRRTEYWRNFLVSLLNLSPEIWDTHRIFPEDLARALTSKEKEELLEKHSSMVTEGKQSPLVAFLRQPKAK